MAEFKEVFETYGADYQVTMERFLNNERTYLRFLDMLFQDETLNQLGNALETNDLIAAFEAAHTLKGVVGNMGLKPLYESICAILEPLRTGELRSDYLDLYQVIRSEFGRAEQLCEALKGVCRA